MARKPRWEEILPKLEGLLGAVLAGTAELPATDDGKVNVLQLVRKLGFKDDDRQYFYKWAELHKPLNAAAAQVGLAPIRPRGSNGSATPDDQANAVFLPDRLGGWAHKELEGENVELRARVRRLEQELNAVSSECERLKKRFALIQELGTDLRIEPVHDL
ncbi:conserved hypothetical protein [Hyphomicrobiales bacterium]|nr:conserved hypothetical protein [Hyphomicrobiales bacterium]CAH1699849.1 conserved hypothetical protein [Hyphomicrobiales bacterium]CAI0343578.1 conserved hypothetical protein [Hyphomicrobiales bacterium]